MPRGLIFRLIVMLIAAIAAYFYFRSRGNAYENIEIPDVSVRSAFELGPCDVTHVTDGDTLNVRCDGRKERVRLLQVDTPERDDPLYEESTRALEALIAGRAVDLELGAAEERDDYGRLLAYVFADDVNLNLAMIEGGWSPYFDRYGAGAYPGEFAQAERAARAAKRGIWGGSGDE